MERTWVALSLALLLVAVAGAPPADQQAQPALIQQGTQAQAQSQQSQQELNRRMLSHLQQLMVDLEHQVENSVPQEFSQQATTDRVSRARTAAHATGMFPRQEHEPHALVESKAEQKTEQKTEQKVEQKVEQKAQEKIEQAKAEVMVETKAKTEAKTEAKNEAKTEAKAEAKTETKGKKDEEEGEGEGEGEEKKKKVETKAPAATGPLAGLPSVLTTLTGTPSISSLQSGLAQPVPDWLAPEVMERGTLQSNLHTAQEAISTSARLYAVYQQSLSALFTQARNYKPQVAQWIRQQKEKAAETVENVKSTLAALEPQLYTLENIIVDAKNKEAYYRRQANHLQVERQLQTSAPVEDAVKATIMPQDKFEAALSKLQHLASQAQKVREEAERALAEKKNMIETGARWLRDSKGTLTAWLTRQAKHLRLVLLQARELAADWKVKLLHFSQVHTQATVLVKQYTLALQRVAAEEKIARLRAAYRARSRQDPDYANDPWEREDMRTKIANAQREVENLSRQMAWDSPPSPPAEWLSWLAADPNPVITAPLHMAPVSTEVLSAPIKFTPLKLTVPPAPAAPPAAINKMKAEKKEESEEEGEKSFLSVASSVHAAADPAQMRFAQVNGAAAQPVIRAHPKDKVFAEDAKPLLDGFPGLHPTAFAKRDISVNAARGGRMPIPDAPPKVPEVKTLPPARDFVEQHFRNSPIGAAYVNIGKSRLGSMQKPPNLKPGTFHVKYMPSSFGRLPPEYIATASAGIDPKYAADLFHPILTPPSSFAYSALNPANHSPFYNAHPAFSRAPVFRMGVPPAYPALPPPPLPSAGTW